jgi:hypothetical protein
MTTENAFFDGGSSPPVSPRIGTPHDTSALTSAPATSEFSLRSTPVHVGTRNVPVRGTMTAPDNGFVDSGSSPPAAALTKPEDRLQSSARPDAATCRIPAKQADGLRSSEPPLSPVPPQANESVELRQCAECGVTRVSRQGAKFCCSACRQAAYRKSLAHLNNLARHSAARLNRRVMWRKRRLRDKAAGNFLHISGPDAVGVPRLGDLDMKQHLALLTPAEIQQAHKRLEERRSVKLENRIMPAE